MSERDACPICLTPFEPADLCATDIELGTCHVACLDGSPVVDLDTGEPSSSKIGSFRYDGLDEPSVVRLGPVPVSRADFAPGADGDAGWSALIERAKADTILSPRGGQTEAVAYELVKRIGRLPHPGDEDFSYPAEDDAERDVLNGLIADAREVMAAHPAGAEAPSVVGAELREALIEAVVARAGRRPSVTAGIDEALAALSPQALGES